MRRFENVVCTFCGALCDDLEVTVEDNRIEGVKNACAIGKAKLMNFNKHRVENMVSGTKTSFENAVNAAIDILSRSKHTLIYGLSSTTCEAQKKAIEIAELIGASIDSTSSVCHGPGTLAKQLVGIPTCTLGEVKNRADLVVFWGCNPMEAHQRHFARYSVMPGGEFINGRKERFVVVVDVRPTPSSKTADMFLKLRPDSDYEVLTALRAILKGEEITAQNVGGVSIDLLTELVARLKECKYGVIFYGMGLTMTQGKYMNVYEAISLVQDLNAHTRFNVIPMRGHGNVAGAEQTLSWSSGYPFAVNYSRGYPQYNPGEFSAVDLLARKEVDSALIIASDPGATLPRKARKTLEEIPVIVLDPHLSETVKLADVVISTTISGIGTGGTFYRMDGVPLKLTRLVNDKPGDESVLSTLLERLKTNVENNERSGL